MKQMRADEFARLGGEVYVDLAGSTLPSERQLRDVFQVGARRRIRVHLILHKCFTAAVCASTSPVTTRPSVFEAKMRGLRKSDLPALACTIQRRQNRHRYMLTQHKPQFRNIYNLFIEASPAFHTGGSAEQRI